MKKKNLAFTLAEVLIVIGIIGVVAALTLPNLNHATGDKETVTRLQKAYSILNEANDRAVAIYGPISSWKTNEQCANDLDDCWMKRIGEFLKVSKSCGLGLDNNVSCSNLFVGDMDLVNIGLQLSDGMVISSDDNNENCDSTAGIYNDICDNNIDIDINGPNKGSGEYGKDVFTFSLSDSLGLIPDDSSTACIRYKDGACTAWVLENGNLDYLKADSTGKCNDSNIILDGVTNTSCH